MKPQAWQVCDECGHPSTDHRYDLNHPTCWAEERCAACVRAAVLAFGGLTITILALAAAAVVLWALSGASRL